MTQNIKALTKKSKDGVIFRFCLAVKADSRFYFPASGLRISAKSEVEIEELLGIVNRGNMET